MNKIMLIGRLTRDPDLKRTGNGVSVCAFTIAVDRNHTSGDEKETDFFNVNVWRGVGENCSKYLKKGSKVAIIGSVYNRSYEDKNGVKRNVTDIVANEVEFLSSKTENTQQGNDNQKLEPVEDDDLPF